MKVNFDNMRMQMVKCFNDAVINFNDRNYEWVEANLNELREYIGALCCIYNKNEEKFSDLGDVELLEAKMDS